MMNIRHNKIVITIALLLQLCFSSNVFSVPPPGNEHAKAQAAFERGDHRQAAMYFQRMLREDPENSGYKAGLAKSYEKNNRLDLAEQHASQALESDKYNVEALMVMGRLHTRQENWAAAKGFFERAIKEDSNNPMAWAGLSQAAIGLGDIGTAEISSAQYLKFSQTGNRSSVANKD